ncbi:MAG: hypothetical protein ABDH32_03765 [Candidatus Caldarchaeales archaeon]
MRIVNNEEKMKEAEAILLDCDGTIIDASKSYDLAIKLATVIVLDKLFNIEIKLGREIEKTIESLRMTGGFNNDSDTTSAIIQAISIFLPITVEYNIDKWERIEDMNEYIHSVQWERSYPGFVSTALEWLSTTVELDKNYLDLEMIERLIDDKASRLYTSKRLLKLRSFLKYPGAFGESFLTTLFDEIFLGRDGVREKYGQEPRYVIYSGTLSNEKILISEESIRRLTSLFPKGIALITGRGRWETEKTLKPILDYINMEASVFTADRGSDFEKPSPKAVLEVARILQSTKLLYVGNSMEDLLMASSASREGLDVGFIGVVNDRDRAREFEIRGADAIIDDINELPLLIQEVKFERC